MQFVSAMVSNIGFSLRAVIGKNIMSDAAWDRSVTKLDGPNTFCVLQVRKRCFLSVYENEFSVCRQPCGPVCSSKWPTNPCQHLCNMNKEPTPLTTTSLLLLSAFLLMHDSPLDFAQIGSILATIPFVVLLEGWRALFPSMHPNW
jgi:hypothetical protein